MAKKIESTGIYDGSTRLANIRRELFVSNLLQGMDSAEAYHAAGFKTKDPKRGGCVLRQQPEVIARLAYRSAKLFEKLSITEESVLAETAKLAFANMQDFIGTDAEGNFIFKDWEGLSREQLAAVQSVTVTQEKRVSKKGTEISTQQTKFALHNKQVSLEQLQKYLGLFQKDNEQQRQVIMQMLKFSINTNGNGNGHRDHQSQVPDREVLDGVTRPEVAG